MTLKERIRLGEAFHLGSLSIEMTSDQMSAARAGADWDMAFVDLQHAPYTEPRVVEFCCAAQALELPILFRAEHPCAAWKLGRSLDFGAAGVLVPMCDDPAWVSDAVRSFYYPPLGNRSCGLRHAYGWQGQRSPRAYADWWNENGILAIQIESVSAVRNVRQLVQPGVDLLLFGACDLGFSIEATPDCPFSSVAECQRHVVEQTSDLDVRVGVADLPFGRFEAVV